MYPIHVTEYLDATVAQCPDRTAVHDGDAAITFAALRERALDMALRIRRHLGGSGCGIVAVHMPKSLDAIVAQLGILYSGNAYMNLDVSHPPRRLAGILEQVRPRLVIDGGGTPLPEPGGIPRLTVAGGEATAPLSPEERALALGLRAARIDTDPLCVINTSGSTGMPKSVALSHRNFIDFIEAVDAAGIVGRRKVAASLAPMVFDHYSFELCLLMARACTLVLVPHGLAAFPVRMLELMAARRVSFLFWVPTIMVNIANMDLLSRIPLPELDTVWFAGEVFPTAKFNYWRAMLPDAVFVNLYGPTETAVDCLYHVIRRPLRDDEPIPIGRPFRNTAVLVLDADGAPVTRPGREGELCVRGSSLSLGYCRDPRKTEAAFTQNPFNDAWPERIYRTGDMVAYDEAGDLIFRGRRDSLIKLRGYRIELAEIEHAAVNTLKLVPNCCALYDEAAQRIVLVYEAPQALDEKLLARRLGEVLPRYMIPTVFLQVETMPLNTNGKLDRKALRALL